MIVQFFALVLALSLVQSSTWSRYVPKSQRSTINAAVERTIDGRKVTIHSAWQTGPFIRAWMSDSIDHERIVSDEAERNYKHFRGDIHRILITIFVPTLQTEGKLLNERAILLQRADDRTIFARGKIDSEVAPEHIEGRFAYTYLIIFSRKVNAQPLVRDLKDEIELSLLPFAEGEPLVIKYRVSDLVTEVADL